MLIFHGACWCTAKLDLPSLSVPHGVLVAQLERLHNDKQSIINGSNFARLRTSSRISREVRECRSLIMATPVHIVQTVPPQQYVVLTSPPQGQMMSPMIMQQGARPSQEEESPLSGADAVPNHSRGDASFCLTRVGCWQMKTCSKLV